MDSISSILPFVLLAIFVIVFAVVIVIGIRLDRQRTEALQQMASEWGYSFSKDGGIILSELAAVTNFELFRRGHSHKLSNVLRGKREDFEMLLFDYTYVTGSGKNSSTHRQTVAVMALDHPELAIFSLRPESIFDKLASKFGKVDINFENRPEFSIRYHLTGDDEIAVQRLFTDPVMDFCEGQKNMNLEATGDHLIMLYPGWRAKPEEIRVFMDSAVQVLALLRRPAAAGWGELYDFGSSSKG